MCGDTINQGRQVERGRRISLGFRSSCLLSCLDVRLAPMHDGWTLPVAGSTRRQLLLMAHSSLGVRTSNSLACFTYCLLLRSFKYFLCFEVLRLVYSHDCSVLVLFRHPKVYQINKFVVNYLYLPSVTLLGHNGGSRIWIFSCSLPSSHRAANV